MGHEIITLIPARRGSSRLENKNLQCVGEKSLINRAVEFARNCGLGSIYVFTDYSADEIGCDKDLIMSRSPESATKLAQADAYISEFVENLKLDKEYILLLQPTSPFRQLNTFHELVKLIEESQINNIYATFQESKETVWRKKDRYIEPLEKGLPRIQQLRESIYFEDGNMYLFNAAGYMSAQSLSALNWIPVINQFPYCLDINTPEDLSLAKLLAKEYEI